MSSDDDIFFATERQLGEVVDWMVRTLGLERLDAPDLADGEYFLKARSRLVHGRGVLLLVRPNFHAVADPQPDEVSAIDSCTGMVSVRLAGMRNETEQTREARVVFSDLAAARPDICMVLSNALSTFVAAYLPGVGVHFFPTGTSLDVEDIDSWRAWVVG